MKTKWIRWVLAVGFAFSSEFTKRVSLPAYGMRAILIMLWVWLFEVGLRKHNHAYIAAASALYFINTSDAYYFPLYTALLSGYVCLRVFSLPGKAKETEKQLVPIWLTKNLFAGICGYRVIWEGIEKARASIRVGSEASSVPLFTNPQELLTGFYRTIWTDITGIWFNYIGTLNVLEDLGLCCGIMAFLFVPVSLYFVKGKQRIALRVAYGFAAIYLCVGWVHYLANGQGKLMTWKTASLWITILNIYACANAIEVIVLCMGRRVSGLECVSKCISSRIMQEEYGCKPDGRR